MLKTERVTIYDVEIRKPGSPVSTRKFRNDERALDWAVEQTKRGGTFLITPRREDREALADLRAALIHAMPWLGRRRVAATSEDHRITPVIHEAR
jgi:hypothetical protein